VLKPENLETSFYKITRQELAYLLKDVLEQKTIALGTVSSPLYGIATLSYKLAQYEHIMWDNTPPIKWKFPIAHKDYLTRSISSNGLEASTNEFLVDYSRTDSLIENGGTISYKFTHKPKFTFTITQTDTNSLDYKITVKLDTNEVYGHWGARFVLEEYNSSKGTWERWNSEYLILDSTGYDERLTMEIRRKYSY
jgi:hypothetical protein